MTITETKAAIDAIKDRLSRDFDMSLAQRLHDLEDRMFAEKPLNCRDAIHQIEFLADYLLEAESGPHPAEEMLRRVIDRLQGENR